MGKITKEEKYLIEQYIKSFDKQIVKVDVEQDSIIYDKSLSMDKKIKMKNCGDEEWTRAFIITKLVNELGYPVERIKLEKRFNLGRGAKEVYVDVRLSDANGDAFLFFEIKSPSQYEIEMETAIENQLIKVASQEIAEGHNVKYLVYSSINFTNNSVQDISILLDYSRNNSYELWKENREYTDTIPSNYGLAIKKPYVRGSDKDLELDYSESTINQLSVKLHDVLWGGGATSDNDIFSALTNLILAKIHDEDTTSDDEAYKFQSNTFIDSNEEFESLEDLYDRINGLYIDAVKERMSITNEADIPPVVQRGKFSLSKLKHTVQTLEKYAFRAENGVIANQDLLGKFFEGIIQSDYKQSKGQFFTPQNIVKFMFYAVKADEQAIELINNGTPSLPYFIDPSAGSGTFMVEFMRLLTHEISKTTKLKRNPQITQKRNQWFPSWAENTWAQQYVYGIELNHDLGTAVKVNMILHGDGSANVFSGTELGDGLSKFTKYLKLDADGNKRDNNELEKNILSDVYSKPVNEHFDIIMSNPPFSVKLDGDTQKEVASNFIFSNKSSENLFIERYYQLLKPNGRLAVVLPESIFDTAQNKYIRVFLFKYFKIKALVSLPQTTFAYTPTKTSILFAQKKTNDEIKNWNKNIIKACLEYNRLSLIVGNLYKVFFEEKDEKKLNIKELSGEQRSLAVAEFLQVGIGLQIDSSESWEILLEKYKSELLDTEGNRKQGLLIPDKDLEELTEGYKVNINWVLRYIANKTELQNNVFMAETEHIGFKVKKRKGKVILQKSKNELYLEDENGEILTVDTEKANILSLIREIEWDKI